jgi:hypothetical protein
MDSCGYAPALLLLQLMQSFIAEKQAQRATTVACSSSGVIPAVDSFLFNYNNLKFRDAEDALNAAVAYLASSSVPRLLQPCETSMISTVSADQVETSMISTVSADHVATPSLLVIMGADSLPMVQDAALAFTKTWYPAGCRRIVITGGIGRATHDLIASYLKRTMQGNANRMRTHVLLPLAHALGGPKTLPLLQDYSSFSVSWPPTRVSQ